MLHKCANPSCSSPFRRLSEGRLFLVESEAVNHSNLSRRDEGRARHIEHYWLCNQCAGLFTLSFEKGRGLVTVPLPFPARKPMAHSLPGEATADRSALESVRKPA